MLHESTRKLIMKLHELTLAGQIPWREGERRTSVFESEGYLVEIEADPPTVRVLTTEGRELERIDAAELASEAWPEGSGNFDRVVGEMANRAHRVARGAEKAIASILSALSAPPTGRAPPPAPPKPPEPEPVAAAPPAQPAPAPQPEPPPAPHAVLPNVDRAAPPPPTTAQPAPQPAPEPAAPGDGKKFGDISGFSRPLPQQPHAPAPQPQAERPRPYGLSMTGFSASTRQNTRGEEIRNDKPATPPPAPADVYKPWS